MRLRALTVAAAVCLGLPGTALATSQYQLAYDPPLVKFDDPSDIATEEDLQLNRVGSSFVFLNQPSGFFVAKDPKDECEFIVGGGQSCPVAGVERMIVNLGGLGDAAVINLGRSAVRVTQVLRGEEGRDRIEGQRGPQRLLGGPGGDALKGGAGRDVLIGGPGDDTCNGGPGNDVIRSC